MGRSRAHVLTGSLSHSGGGMRDRREGQVSGAGGRVGCPGGHRAGAWNGFAVGLKPCPRGWGSGRASLLRSRVPADLWVAPIRSETSRVRFHSSAGGLKSLGAHPHLSCTQSVCVCVHVCACVRVCVEWGAVGGHRRLGCFLQPPRGRLGLDRSPGHGRPTSGLALARLGAEARCGTVTPNPWVHRAPHPTPPARVFITDLGAVTSVCDL